MASFLRLCTVLALVLAVKGQGGMFDIFGGMGGMGGGMDFFGGPTTGYGGVGGAPATQAPNPAELRDARFTMAEEQMAEVLGESPRNSPERQRIDRLIQATGGRFSGDAAPLNYLVNEYLATSPPPPTRRPPPENANEGGGGRRGGQRRRNNRRRNRQNNRVAGGGAGQKQPTGPYGAVAGKTNANSQFPAQAVANGKQHNVAPGSNTQFGPAQGGIQPQYASGQATSQFGAAPQPVIEKSGNGWQMKNPGQMSPTVHKPVQKPVIQQQQMQTSGQQQNQQNANGAYQGNSQSTNQLNSGVRNNQLSNQQGFATSNQQFSSGINTNNNQMSNQQAMKTPANQFNPGSNFNNNNQQSSQQSFRASNKQLSSGPNNNQHAFKASNQQFNSGQTNNQASNQQVLRTSNQQFSSGLNNNNNQLSNQNAFVKSNQFSSGPNNNQQLSSQQVYRTSNQQTSQTNINDIPPRGLSASRVSNQQISSQQNINIVPAMAQPVGPSSNRMMTASQQNVRSGPQSNQNQPGSPSNAGRGALSADRLKRIEGRILYVSEQLKLARRFNDVNQMKELEGKLSALQNVKTILSGGSGGKSQMLTVQGSKRGPSQSGVQGSFQRSSAGNNRQPQAKWNPQPNNQGQQAQVSSQALSSQNQQLSQNNPSVAGHRDSSQLQSPAQYETIKQTGAGPIVNKNNGIAQTSQGIRPGTIPGAVRGPPPPGFMAAQKARDAGHQGSKQAARNERPRKRPSFKPQVITRPPPTTTTPKPTGPPPQLGDIRWQGNIEYIYADADGFDTFQWVKTSSLPTDQKQQLIQERQAARKQEQQQQRKQRNQQPPADGAPTTPPA